MENENIPVFEKLTLTVKEASLMSNIGEHKLRSIAKEPGCRFSLFVGRRILIKRKNFEEYLNNHSVL